jgi:hypothetical protein
MICRMTIASLRFVMRARALDMRCEVTRFTDAAL